MHYRTMNICTKPSTYLCMDIGKAIKALRKEKGLSQLQLGLAIGNDSAYISRIENNKKEPSLTMLVRIAEALELCPLYLLENIFSKHE